jgi:glucokinase
VKWISCFDIGGTFVKFGLVNEKGEIRGKGKFPTPVVNTRDELIKKIAELVGEQQLNYPVAAIGISSCGIVDSNSGVVIFSSNLPELTGTAISEILSDETGLQVFVENDVRCASLGERWAGASKDYDNSILLTIGTGIGSGIIVDGQLLRGGNGFAGELGHIIIEQDGELCGCGGRGCYEQYASTSALIRQYHKESGDLLSGEAIIKRVLDQEETALKVYDRFIEYLTSGLVTITHLFNPEVIIIGGGIMEQGDIIIKDTRKNLLKRTIPLYHNLTIQGSALKNDAGLIGACYIALFRQENFINNYYS